MVVATAEPAQEVETKFRLSIPFISTSPPKVDGIVESAKPQASTFRCPRRTVESKW